MPEFGIDKLKDDAVAKIVRFLVDDPTVNAYANRAATYVTGRTESSFSEDEEETPVYELWYSAKTNTLYHLASLALACMYNTGLEQAKEGPITF